jgi:hypothetical protein
MESAPEDTDTSLACCRGRALHSLGKVLLLIRCGDGTWVKFIFRKCVENTLLYQGISNSSWIPVPEGHGAEGFMSWSRRDYPLRTYPRVTKRLKFWDKKCSNFIIQAPCYSNPDINCKPVRCWRAGARATAPSTPRLFSQIQCLKAIELLENRS